MTLTFHEEALKEYDAALDYYINRSEKAARAFAAEFELSANAIIANPLRWRKEGESARIYLMPNFPYTLIYRPSNDEVVLLALAHHRRRPGYWRRR